MPVELSHLRSVLFPGLLEIASSRSALAGYTEAFAPSVAAPHIWVPKLSLPQAIAVGAAAAIIKNPVITRRFWAGWFSPNT